VIADTYDLFEALSFVIALIPFGTANLIWTIR
jgi:hypothetical protein